MLVAVLLQYDEVLHIIHVLELELLCSVYCFFLIQYDEVLHIIHVLELLCSVYCFFLIQNLFFF